MARYLLPMRQTACQGYHAYADTQPENLRRRLFEAEAFLQLRDQICQRHVDEAAADHDQEVGQVVLQLVDQPVTGQAANGGNGAGERDFDQGNAFVAAVLVEHHQVAHVVRNFMRQHGQCGDPAQALVGHEGGGDEHPVAKAVHAVARQQGPAAGLRNMAVMVAMAVMLGMTMAGMVGAIDRVVRNQGGKRQCRRLWGLVVLMAVVPQLGFVEQKEKNQPRQQDDEQLFSTRLAFKRLWQQVHEGGGQQRACRQTEHVLGVAGQSAKTQGCCHPNAANTGSQGGQDDVEQGHEVNERSKAGWKSLIR